MPLIVRENVGEVHVNSATTCELEWRIPDFKSEKTIVSYSSPVFKCNGISFFIRFYLNVFHKWLPIYFSLTKESLVPRLNKLEVSFALKTSDGKKSTEANCTKHLVLDTYEKYYSDDSALIAELLEKESELLPSGALTVLCTMKNLKSIEEESDNETEKCSHCKEIVDAKHASTHEKKCLNKPIKCPECSEVVILKNWYEHECRTARTKDDEALIRDFKKMLSDGKNHDLILKIGDKELRAHTDILRSRSHVFESMLNHDMKEKNSGIIDVPDCDSEAMELFLLYIYTGKVETLDQQRMLGLYYIADKYEMQGLIKECRNFIKKSLSHTNICDVIQLAVNHSDSGLLEYATEYFIENALEITVTVEWQSFLKDNTTLGNELIIKSFRKLKDVKS